MINTYLERLFGPWLTNTSDKVSTQSSGPRLSKKCARLSGMQLSVLDLLAQIVLSRACRLGKWFELDFEVVFTLYCKDLESRVKNIPFLFPFWWLLMVCLKIVIENCFVSMLHYWCFNVTWVMHIGHWNFCCFDCIHVLFCCTCIMRNATVKKVKKKSEHFLGALNNDRYL